MSIFDIFKTEKRSNTTQVQETTFTPYGDALLFGQVQLNGYSAQNLSSVFRCADLISDSVSILPIRVVGKENHPLNLVFKSGLYNMSKQQFMKLLIQSVLLKGNGFALIERAKDGTVISLRFLQSDDVQVHFDKNKPSTLYYTCSLIPQKKIEPINIIHLRKYSIDGYNGRSVLTYAAKSIKLSQNAEANATDFYEKGRNLSGVLKVDGNVTKNQRDTIHEQWNGAMVNGGTGLAILQGNMTYTPIQLNAADSQLLESRLFQVSEIARFFGINPVLLGDLSHSSYSTLEAAQQEFVLHTLWSYVIMVEQEFTAKLLKPSESNLSIELDENYILKTDKNTQANYYNSLLSNGVLSINEVREKLGYEPIEGGDAHTIPYTKIEDNLINKKQDTEDDGREN